MRAEKIFKELQLYCEKENYKGWDIFDGLNSKVFQSLPFKNIPLFRLIWIQFFKRSPLNLRKIFKVSKEHNPKGLGLFLSAECRLYEMNPKESTRKKIDFLIKKIIELKSNGYSGACWGYNFDWQARAFFLPKWTPTIVTTSYIANALLDSYDLLKDQNLLNEARSACNFILKDIKRSPLKDGTFCFSYSPLGKTQIYNASLLGSRLLSRTYSYTNEAILKEEAQKSVQYCINAQKGNGSWSYGALPFHQWVDNFHTGYNLECIADHQKFSGDKQYQKHLDKGLSYYLNTFFTEEGISKYYNNRMYPIDIHSTAQLIITLFKLGKLKEKKELVDKVLNWTFDNMYSNKGYFYGRKTKFFMSKIPYMRWTQAWIYYALAYYLYEFQEDHKKRNL